jgi:cytochrome oxidase Cu insertion factor (SCO1/SenC/PrrC family)
MKDNDQVNYQTLDHDGDLFIQKVTDTVVDNIKRYPKLKVIVVPKTFTIPCLNPKLRLDFVAPVGNPIRLGKNIKNDDDFKVYKQLLLDKLNTTLDGVIDRNKYHFTTKIVKNNDGNSNALNYPWYMVVVDINKTKNKTDILSVNHDQNKVSNIDVNKNLDDSSKGDKTMNIDVNKNLDDSSKGDKTMNATNSNNNMFGNFIDNNADLSKIKLTMNGLGVQADDGTVKIYKNGKIIDVTQFSLQNNNMSSMVFLVPAKKVKQGDLIVNNGTFVFVVDDDGDSIKVIDFNNNSQRTIVRQQHALIPFSFVTKVYSPILNGGNMNNMLPFMMMNNGGGGGMNDMMQMMMMSKMFKNNGNTNADDVDDDMFGDISKMFDID